MKFIKTIFALLAVVVIAAVLWGLRRTYKVEHGANEELFQAGTADMTALDGDFTGTVTGYNGSWQGKTFMRTENAGINRFLENGAIVTKYPFKTYVGKGLRNEELDVIKLDYNQPGNPWWLQYIVDEIVLVAPAKYLGKVHIHLMSGVTFSVGYFTIEPSVGI